MSFGRDLGLVHEAVITGHKIGAGADFWAALAHSQKAFAAVANLATHIALLERLEKVTIPARDKSEELEAWLESHEKLSGCLYCGTPEAKVLGKGFGVSPHYGEA